MPARATGEIVALRGGAFAVRCLVGPGPRDRELFTLVGCRSRDDAKRRAGEVAGLASRLRRAGLHDDAHRYASEIAEHPERREAVLRFVNDEVLAGSEELTGAGALAAGPTLGAVFDAWFRGDYAKAHPTHFRVKRTADDDESRYEKHIAPSLRDVPIADVTLEACEAVVGAVQEGSRTHVAQLLTYILKKAAYPLKLIAASPLPAGFLPRKKRKKALSCLFVDEEERLIACAGVPVANRVLYAWCHREGMRASEALRMTWSDLDLARGTVRLDRNKTSDPRSWKLDPGMADALRRWFVLAGRPARDRAVFDSVQNQGHLANSFREHLATAGVTREELFERSDVRQPLRFHDARSAFVSTALACGKSEGWISQRTGHRSSAQIHAYRRLAQTLTDLGTAWFVSPAEAIPELAALGVPSPRTPNDDGGSRAKTSKVHGERLELSRLAAAEPKADSGDGDHATIAGKAPLASSESRQIEPDRTAVGSSVGHSTAEEIASSLADDLDDAALESIARALLARLAARAKRGA